MSIDIYNKTESRYYHTFIVKRAKDSYKEYYRIELNKLAELLGVGTISVNYEVEDLLSYVEL